MPQPVPPPQPPVIIEPIVSRTVASPFVYAEPEKAEDLLLEEDSSFRSSSPLPNSTRLKSATEVVAATDAAEPNFQVETDAASLGTAISVFPVTKTVESDSSSIFITASPANLESEKSIPSHSDYHPLITDNLAEKREDSEDLPIASSSYQIYGVVPISEIATTNQSPLQLSVTSFNESETISSPTSNISLCTLPSCGKSENKISTTEELTTDSPNLDNARNLVIPDLNRIPGQGKVTRLITQERGGKTREFYLGQTESETPVNSQEVEIPVEDISVVEISADSQEFDQERQIIAAEGNVEMRFANAVLTADRVEVNLNNRLAVASGSVALVRGEQVLRGERFEYFFVQDNGVITSANGEIFLPQAEQDFSAGLPTDVGAETVPERPLSDRLAANQPLRRITTDDGYSFVIGSRRNISNISLPRSGGRINRLRFQAERIDFDGSGWQATDIRVTNDPFSPPELELRADTAQFRNIAPLVDEITTTNSRLVFDQNFKVPIFQDRIILDRRPREPGFVTFGFDDDERGGLFVERSFKIIDNEQVQFKVTPQYFLQRAVFEDGFSFSTLGAELDFEAKLAERTNLVAAASFTSLDFGEIEDELRASVRLRQLVGEIENPHSLNFEYSYRDRLFNGSLGFQTVQSSLGVVLTSPSFILGDTGINFSYQLGTQLITSTEDEDDDDEFTTLLRSQGAISASRGFLLWQGEALPPTPEEGLKYTPTPVQPFLQLSTGFTGVGSFYSNGDGQQTLSASLGLEGQVGHFSRPYLDYTGFKLAYTQSIINGRSPFSFDRDLDSQTLSLGLTQQLYGPFRFGVQTSLSLNRDQEISTDYFLEYNRRTYNAIIRFNPTLELGSFSFRVNDFNWVGSPEPFSGTGVRPVRQGVRGRRFQ